MREALTVSKLDYELCEVAMFWSLDMLQQDKLGGEAHAADRAPPGHELQKYEYGFEELQGQFTFLIQTSHVQSTLEKRHTLVMDPSLRLVG